MKSCAVCFEYNFKSDLCYLIDIKHLQICENTCAADSLCCTVNQNTRLELPEAS